MSDVEGSDETFDVVEEFVCMHVFIAPVSGYGAVPPCMMVLP